MNQMAHPAFLWPDADSDLLSRRTIITGGTKNIPYQQSKPIEPEDIPHVSGFVHDIARLLEHGGVSDDRVRNILRAIVKVVRAVPGDEISRHSKDNLAEAGLLMFPRLLKHGLGTKDWKSPLLHAVFAFGQEELNLPHNVHMALFRHLKEATQRVRNPTIGIAQIAMTTTLLINDAKSRHKFKDDQPVVTNGEIKTAVNANGDTGSLVTRSIVSFVKALKVPVRLPSQRIKFAASQPQLHK